MKSTVGIVTPCFNSERYIERCIESVDRQSYTNWQHVIVDDGSTDGTPQLLEQICEQNAKRDYRRQPNAGPAVARNRGAAMLPEEVQYLLFLDSDDYLRSDALEVAVEYLTRHPHVDTLLWNMSIVDEQGEVLARDCRDYYKATGPWGLGQRHVPTRWWMRALSDDEPLTPPHAIITDLGIPSRALMTKQAYLRSGGFPEEEMFREGAEDLHLFVKLALEAEMHFIPDRMTFHRRHGENLTSDSRKMNEQARRLHHLWHRKRRELSDEQRRQVESFLYFLKLRYRPFQHLQAIRPMLDQRQYAGALRIVIGAAWRYMLSLIPERLGYDLLARAEGWE